MNTSVFKIFFSKISEEKWLNEMGEKGFELVRVHDSKYTFVKSENLKYNYSIQQLGFSPKSVDAIEYYKSLESSGTKPTISSGNWVYFVKTNGKIAPSSEVYKKNSMPYFWRSLYMLFFGLCGSIVCGYQIFAIKFLQRVGYEGKGAIEKTFSTSQNGGLFNTLLNALKGLGNAFFKLLNAYFKLWTNAFGNSDAVAVISIVAPITIILLILGAMNLQRYLEYRSLSKNTNDNYISSDENVSDEKVEVIDAEQNI